METATKKENIVNIYVPVKNVYYNNKEGYSIVNLADDYSFVVSNKFVSTTKKGLNFSIGILPRFTYKATYAKERFEADGQVIINKYFDLKRTK